MYFKEGFYVYCIVYLRDFVIGLCVGNYYEGFINS